MTRINYNFFDLEENSKHWQKQMFFQGKYLNATINRIIELIQKNLNCSERGFCKKLRLSRRLIRNIRGKNGLYPVRISTINYLLEQLKPEEQNKYTTEINEQIEKVSFYQSFQWIKIPKCMTPTLAEILGRHAGDGSITKTTYTIKITVHDRIFAEKCKNDLKEIFNIEPIVQKDRNCLAIKINSLPLTLIFSKYFGMPWGKKSDIIRMPEIIKQSDMECKLAFLRGYIDTDGSLYKNKNGKNVLEIDSDSKGILLDCKEIIDNLSLQGISLYSSFKKGKNRYRLRISVASTPLLIEKVKSNHPKIINCLAGL